MNYLTEKEFNRHFKLLNTICGDYSQWASPKATKQYKCEFGCNIAENEQYFRKQYTDSRADVVRLCKSCMEKILFILFATDSGTTKIASWIADKRFARMRKAVEKLRERS